MTTGCPSEQTTQGVDTAAPNESRSPGDAWFVERASVSGIDFVHRSGHDGRHLFPEIVAGGAALFDMDDDGDLDAYLVQAGRVTDPGASDGRNRLYRNDGRGMFVDVSAGSGAQDAGYGMGVTTGDYDGDGDVDLYVTNLGADVLLQNLGGGRFRDVTAEAGTDNPSWGTSAAFVDVDGDRDLDLFVVNYVNWSLTSEQDCYNATGALDYCLPTNYGAPAMDRLFLNDGGRFRDVTREAGLDRAFGNGLGIVADDFDADGRVDLFVANDTMPNQLWINQGEGRFVDEALVRGAAIDEHGQAKAGMGVVSEDVDRDGDPDVLVVNLEGQTDSFFANDGGGYFIDRTGSMGLGQASRSNTRFGIGLVDLDGDGWLDLFQANGRVIRNPVRPDAPFREENFLFRGRPGGRFTPVGPPTAAGPGAAGTSRAAAFGDVDLDGDVDILVANKDGPAHLLINVVERAGGWLRLDVREAHGAPALGAVVRFRVDGSPRVRVVRSAYSYCAANDPRVDVGMGQAAGVTDVVVRWTDGEETAFGDLSGGETHVLRR